MRAKKEMIGILLAGDDKDALSGLKSGFEQCEKVRLYQAGSCEAAFQLILDHTVDLVIVDEAIGDITGVGFAEKLVSVSPMTHCAVVSSLSENEFHEASEGLGVLMQLPPRPEEKEAWSLFIGQAYVNENGIAPYDPKA